MMSLHLPFSLNYRFFIRTVFRKSYSGRRRLSTINAMGMKWEKAAEVVVCRL